MAKILIIDDQPEVRDILRRSLEIAGHAVTEASNGSHGIEAYRRERADVVITDILMPDRDGMELIASLRRVDPGARILAISGGGSKGRVDYLGMATILGAKATLNKPFTPKQVVDKVAGLLQD
jgi:DNA-binding NtrC family response regulator